MAKRLAQEMMAVARGSSRSGLRRRHQAMMDGVRERIVRVRLLPSRSPSAAFAVPLAVIGTNRTVRR
jgi:hypothetical protein